MKKMISAAIGGALLTGAMLGCGEASADAYGTVNLSNPRAIFAGSRP